jgi:hypothetical protein
MGDDCLEEPVEGAEALYALYGHPLKNYDVAHDTYNFCSFDIDRETGAYTPADPTKSLYSLLVKREATGSFEPSALLAFQHHVRHHPERELYYSVLESLGADITR